MVQPMKALTRDGTTPSWAVARWITIGFLAVAVPLLTRGFIAGSASKHALLESGELYVISIVLSITWLAEGIFEPVDVIVPKRHQLCIRGIGILLAAILVFVAAMAYIGSEGHLTSTEMNVSILVVAAALFLPAGITAIT